MWRRTLRADDVLVTITWDAEGTHPLELQRQGWPAILDNFARHVEANGSN